MFLACITIVRQVGFYSWERYSWYTIARYWKDPRKFMPERFLGDWSKDAFIPFSLGISGFVLILDP